LYNAHRISVCVIAVSKSHEFLLKVRRLFSFFSTTTPSRRRVVIFSTTSYKSAYIEAKCHRQRCWDHLAEWTTPLKHSANDFWTAVSDCSYCLCTMLSTDTLLLTSHKLQLYCRIQNNRPFYDIAQVDKCFVLRWLEITCRLGLLLVRILCYEVNMPI